MIASSSRPGWLSLGFRFKVVSTCVILPVTSNIYIYLPVLLIFLYTDQPHYSGMPDSHFLLRLSLNVLSYVPEIAFGTPSQLPETGWSPDKPNPYSRSAYPLVFEFLR